MLDLDAMERDAGEGERHIAWPRLEPPHAKQLIRDLAAHVHSLIAEVRRLRASPAYLFPPTTAAQRAEAAYVRGALEMDYATEDAERERWLELAGDAPAITETEYSRAGAAVLGAYADGAPIIVRRTAITETDYPTE